jgi:hypothetical protein
MPWVRLVLGARFAGDILQGRLLVVMERRQQNYRQNYRQKDSGRYATQFPHSGQIRKGVQR